MNLLLNIIQTEVTTTNWFFLVGIQIFLLLLFVAMLLLFCKILKKKDPEKSIKKTCILIWFMSTIGWFIMAQIVWILTYSQFVIN